MFPALSNAVQSLRRPEYTGEHRCLPCTILNLAIVLAVAVALALVWIPAAVAVLVGGTVVIYLRGYLVPGTPTITRRYFPDRVLKWFGKAPDPTGVGVGTDGGVQSAGDGMSDYDNVGELLGDVGIVEDCDDRDDLCLAEAFADVWWRRIRRVRESDRARQQLAASLELDPDELVFHNGERFEVEVDGMRVAAWPSRAAFITDLATKPTLAEWLPTWDDLGDGERGELLASLRVFLDRCPECEGDLSSVEDVTQTCCSGEMVNVSISCEDCEAVLFNGSYR